MVSAAAMNIKAVREPVLNFVFHKSSGGNNTKVNVSSKSTKDIIFDYIPSGYKCSKKQYLYKNNQIIYKYSNDSNDIIYIKVQTNQEYSNYINQSSLEKYDELTYKNKKYYFLSGKSNTLLSYKSNCIFSIISSHSKSELLKIAENIHLKTK